MGIAANINGEYLPTHSWFCGFLDIVYSGGTYLSIWYVALLSLERGLLIIHKIHLPIWIWISIMISEFIIFLVFNLISVSLDQVGLAELAIYCMATPDYSIGYITVMLYFVMMCLCLLTILYSYVGIAIIQRRRAWNDIRELNMDKNETLKQANKIIGKVFFLLFLFLACNLTEIINSIIELVTDVTRSSAADFSSIIMLNINPIANCIVLIQFHQSIKLSLLESYPILANILGKQDIENAQTRSVLNN
jgi:hypothetical protein